MLITHENQINRQHAEQLALKLRLEASLASHCRKLLKTIAGDVGSYYSTNNRSILSTINYKDDMTHILRDHYRMAAKTFKWNIRETSKAASESDVSKLVDSKLVDYIHTRSVRQSGYILDTLSKRIRENINRMVVEAAVDGVSMSTSAIGDRLKRQLSAEASGEADTIGTTEIQNAAETSKYIEASTLDGQDTGEDYSKFWKAMLDEKTRIAHIFADGQTVNLDDTFTVGAEQLLYPGDETNGAELWNLINCRCNCLYLGAALGKALRLRYEQKILKLRGALTC